MHFVHLEFFCVFLYMMQLIFKLCMKQCSLRVTDKKGIQDGFFGWVRDFADIQGTSGLFGTLQIYGGPVDFPLLSGFPPQQIVQWNIYNLRQVQ